MTSGASPKPRVSCVGTALLTWILSDRKRRAVRRRIVANPEVQCVLARRDVLRTQIELVAAAIEAEQIARIGMSRVVQRRGGRDADGFHRQRSRPDIAAG